MTRRPFFKVKISGGVTVRALLAATVGGAESALRIGRTTTVVTPFSRKYLFAAACTCAGVTALMRATYCFEKSGLPVPRKS